MADFQNEGESWEWHIIETFKGLINLSIELLKALTVNQRQCLRSRFSLISFTRWWWTSRYDLGAGLFCRRSIFDGTRLYCRVSNPITTLQRRHSKE
jgi:hypothetical protein